MAEASIPWLFILKTPFSEQISDQLSPSLHLTEVFVFLLFPPFVFDFFHPWEDSVWETLTWTFTRP